MYKTHHNEASAKVEQEHRNDHHHAQNDDENGDNEIPRQRNVLLPEGERDSCRIVGQAAIVEPVRDISNLLD